MVYLILVILMFTLWSADSDTISNNRTSYAGYKTYEMTLETDLQQETINSLKNITGIDFWAEGGQSDTTTLMISPEKIEDFKLILKELEIPYRTIISDVEKLIQKENLQQELARFSNIRSYDSYLHKYLRYDEITSFIENMRHKFPYNVIVETIGRSFENRRINMIKISNNVRAKKNIVVVEAGMHAREWAGPALALHTINKVLEEQELLKNNDWYIIPLANPDGYEFSHNYDRFWRKTRSVHGISSCQGVDGNRNFDSHFGQFSSSDPCAMDYHGTGPFSETETEAIWLAISKIQNRVQAYISLHSYGNKILYPYSFTKEPTTNWRKVDHCALEAREAVHTAGGPTFTVGNTARVLYLASGGADDFMKEKMLIPYAYTVELPGGGRQGFDYPSNQIFKLVNQTFPIIKAISQCAIR